MFARILVLPQAAPWRGTAEEQTSPGPYASLPRSPSGMAFAFTAVTKAIKEYELFPERGTWRDGYRTVKVAIDERGCARFYEVFHGHARVAARARSVRTGSGR